MRPNDPAIRNELIRENVCEPACLTIAIRKRGLRNRSAELVWKNGFSGHLEIGVLQVG